MAFDWLNKIVIKIASEVHKNKIEDFEKRILVIEQEEKVILKTLNDIEAKLDKLDDRIYDNNLKTATALGFVQSLKATAIDNPKFLSQGDINKELP
jgi:hypothetical protein